MVRNILAQVQPAAGATQELYKVPEGMMTTLYTVFIANTSPSPTTFRLAVTLLGGADNPKHYWFYDVDIAGNETVEVDTITQLPAKSIIRGRSGSGLVSFNILGMEVPNP